MMPDRRYPARPIVGVGAVIVTGGQVVLVERRHPPLAGQWSLPGGAVEIGETLAAAVEREVAEETGLRVEVGPLIEVLDRISTDANGRVEYHYVLAEYLCVVRHGALAADSDAAAVALADPAHLESYGLSPRTIAVIRRGLALAAAPDRPPGGARAR